MTLKEAPVSPVYRRANQISAAVLFVLSVMLASVAKGYGLIVAQSVVGPGMYLFLLSLVMGLLAVIWFVQATLWRLVREDSPTTPDREGVFRITTTVVGIALFVPLLNVLGYQVAMLLLCTGILILGFREPKLKSLIVGLVMSFGSYYLFAALLSLPLPSTFR